MACIQSYRAERDQTVKRYMFRLSDAHASQSLHASERGGPPHAEMAMCCNESGSCGHQAADRVGSGCNPMDDGYSCLTAAAAFLHEPAAARAAHERACRCDWEGAQLPVPGSALACDGPGRPVVRGIKLSEQVAARILACGTCDAEQGSQACAAEIAELSETDASLSSFLRTVHVPRCELPCWAVWIDGNWPAKCRSPYRLRRAFRCGA